MRRRHQTRRHQSKVEGPSSVAIVSRADNRSRRRRHHRTGQNPNRPPAQIKSNHVRRSPRPHHRSQCQERRRVVRSPSQLQPGRMKRRKTKTSKSAKKRTARKNSRATRVGSCTNGEHRYQAVLAFYRSRSFVCRRFECPLESANSRANAYVGGRQLSRPQKQIDNQSNFVTTNGKHAAPSTVGQPRKPRHA